MMKWIVALVGVSLVLGGAWYIVHSIEDRGAIKEQLRVATVQHRADSIRWETERAARIKAEAAADSAAQALLRSRRDVRVAAAETDKARTTLEEVKLHALLVANDSAATAAALRVEVKSLAFSVDSLTQKFDKERAAWVRDSTAADSTIRSERRAKEAAIREGNAAVARAIAAETQRDLYKKLGLPLFGKVDRAIGVVGLLVVGYTALK